MSAEPTLPFQMLRQILANQFTILKAMKDETKDEAQLERIEKRLKSTDRLLNKSFNGTETI